MKKIISKLRGLNETVRFLICVAMMTILSLLLSTKVNAQRLVNTEEMYFEYYNTVSDLNDCSIRAYATSLDVDYIKAKREMRKLGKDKDGLILGVFLEYLNDRGYIKGRIDLNDAKPSEAVQKLPRGSYIAYTEGHVFTIKSIENEWIVYGNSTDLDSKIKYLFMVSR